MGSFYDRKPWLNTYPTWLPSKLSVPKHSIADDFLQAASTYPANHFLYYFDRTPDCQEIEKMTTALAAALVGMGDDRPGG